MTYLFLLRYHSEHFLLFLRAPPTGSQNHLHLYAKQEGGVQKRGTESTAGERRQGVAAHLEIRRLVVDEHILLCSSLKSF